MNMRNSLRLSPLLLLFCAMHTSLRAQNWVAVPDANFANFLANNFTNATSVISGTLHIDASHSQVLSTTSLTVSNMNISDLTGLNAFANLLQLNCSGNLLQTIPPLPPMLANLSCNNNQLGALPQLPSTLVILSCSQNALTYLPPLPTGLTTLYCSYNQLLELPALPSSLTNWNCSHNQLSFLPPLPPNITSVPCYNNLLTALPELPPNLNTLNCAHNLLQSLPTLPNSIQGVDFSYNQLTSLPALPTSIINFNCNFNPLTSLPELPASMISMYCHNNLLTSLPTLPPNLLGLRCFNNSLTELPELPQGLAVLDCSGNLLTELPLLPASLGSLKCNSNELAALPSLPLLSELECANNQITCFELFPSGLWSLDISNNPCTCLPNYVSGMNQATLAMPLCDEDNPVNNPYTCPAATNLIGVMGYVFNDVNDDCIQDGNFVPNIPLNLYGSNNTLLGMTTSYLTGVYQFSANVGNYTVSVNPNVMAAGIGLNCPSVNQQTIALTPSQPFSAGHNFGLELSCSSFDLGVQSVLPTGWIFPGQVHNLTILAGDLSAYYGFDCAAGLSGEVTIEVVGPGTVLSFGGNPIYSIGNQAGYYISDFGGFLSNFSANVLTDTTAQSGDLFCVYVYVNANQQDNVQSNNAYVFCYEVVNSYDPNIKMTTPKLVEPGFTDEFTYTIYFQNTGTAPAFNVRLEDVLDVNLDLSTFRVVHASHDYTATLNTSTRKLVVRYKDIMLPDSTSNPEGSIGFVQYRVKPKPGLIEGTIIHNTAAIYIDFNEPIITNTTQNLFSQTSGYLEFISDDFNIFPNPSSGAITIEFDYKLPRKVEIIDVLGNSVYSSDLETSNKTLVLDNLISGVYMVRVIQKEGFVSTKRFIINR